MLSHTVVYTMCERIGPHKLADAGMWVRPGASAATPKQDFFMKKSTHGTGKSFARKGSG